MKLGYARTGNPTVNDLIESFNGGMLDASPLYQRVRHGARCLGENEGLAGRT